MEAIANTLCSWVKISEVVARSELSRRSGPTDLWIVCSDIICGIFHMYSLDRFRSGSCSHACYDEALEAGSNVTRLKW
jgi:hypothetical protein